MEELWKTIDGFNGYYQVSNEGRVKSVDRVVHNKGNGAMCNLKGRILKLKI